MTRLARSVMRYAPWWVWGGTILSVASLVLTVELYLTLRPDLEELLPTTARSVVDLGEVTRRLEFTDNLAIVIKGEDSGRAKDFVDDLVGELKSVPKDVIALVEYHIQEELKFFHDRRPLYLEKSDLLKIESFIKNRILYETELYNPVNIFRSTELKAPFLNMETMEKKYAKRASGFTRFKDGYYATEDGKVRVIICHLPGKLSDMTVAHAMRAAIDERVAKLDPTQYQVEVLFTGAVQNMIEEQASLIADLELATAIVVIAVVLLLIWFFGSVMASLALNTALFMGTLWTFGVSYFLVGSLNANSAFLGAIVIGNGINFGIIFLGRYLEERRKRKTHAHAIYLCMTKTWRATSTAAMAAGLAYGSLMLTSFRGFSQFGVIGFIGMVLCWISAYTLLPAILTAMNHYSWSRIKIAPKAKPTYARRLAILIGRNARPIVAVSALLTLASLGLALLPGQSIIEKDLSKLRDKKSMTEGSGFLAHYLNEVFGRELSPIVVLPQSAKNAEKIGEKLKAQIRTPERETFVENVYTLGDFLPPDQLEKIAILKRIEKLISPLITHYMSDEDRARVKEILSPPALEPVHLEDLPKLIRLKFREKDGTIGKMVLVEPPITTALWEGPNLNQFIQRIRDTADEVEPGAPVAGQLPVSSDMIASITTDGPKATVFAFLSVMGLVIVLFFNLKMIALVLASLLLGVGWLWGLIFLFGLKINFLSFIALPITFGIGVDYGVNIFQRYRSDGSGSILDVIQHTGGVVVVASLTTIIGYGSLVLAGNQAFVSFGTLAVLGELTCILAAIVSIPAGVYLLDRRKKRVYWQE